VVIEVNARSVLGEQGEPAVVCRGNSPAQRVLIGIPFRKILEIPALPAWFDRHDLILPLIFVTSHTIRIRCPQHPCRIAALISIQLILK